MPRDRQGEELAAALRAAVGGEVDFGDGRRAEYSSDASLYRCVPLGVAFPRDTADVEATLAVCRQAGVPLTFRGGGTSIGGQAVGRGVVVDCSRHLNRIVELDPERRLARVEPGLVLDDLRRAAAAHGLDVGPDPSTHSRCTLGGMVGNNSCGSHSVAWGRTAESVVALELLLDDGSRITAGATPAEAAARAIAAGGRAGELHAALRALAADGEATIRGALGRFPRQVSGYALEHLLPERGFDLARALVGSEGTCAVVLQAGIALIEPPAARALVLVGFDDLPAAADEAPAILEHGPLACEGIDVEILDTVRRRAGRGAGQGRPAGARAGGDPGRQGDALGRRPAHPARPVADPRGRRRAGDPPARRPRGVARLGGRRGATGATRRLPARVRCAAGPPWPPWRALRPLRRGLRARAHRLRPARRA